MTRHRILVVDDEPDMRLLLRLMLAGRGYEVAEAHRGEEALEMAGGVDLVLLDLNLPGISGMDVLEAWSQQGVIPQLPVLMLTADARPGLREEALALGCHDYLSKPVPPKELLDHIESALRPESSSTATVEAL
ncbi:MAG: response regulator [Actinomycetota bacterium]|nr:response regulator [Actinomycetota bacterium]